MRGAPARISRQHPLHHLFNELVGHRLGQVTQAHDPALTEYVSSVLTDFTHVDNLYRIRNARGRRVEEVAEMLIEANPLLNASSFDREREVRKHVGDFTLFFTGLFPEAVASLPRLRPLSRDTFVDYVAAGKKSYEIVAAFNLFEYADEAPLFRQLSDRFEQCVFALNMVKRDLEELQASAYRDIRRGLGLGG